MSKMLKDPTPVERLKVAELHRQHKDATDTPRTLEAALAALVMPASTASSAG